ncbi:MAG TPA: hypothetical protein VF178_11055, partial [Gemmatimonadaceae bacterium]
MFQRRVFSQPLVPVGETSADDNRVLAAAIRAYLGGSRDDLAPFARFLADHGDSAWRASLLSNMGVVYARTGFFTRALDAWKEAWDLARDADAPNARAVGDFAMGESLALATRLGNVPMLEEHLRLIEGRTLRGPAESKVALAHQTLAHLRRFPGSVIPSGPRAIQELLRAQHPAAAMPEVVTRYVPTAAGMSLAKLEAMAAAAGLTGMAAKATSNAVPPAGSIVHFRFGHFSAIVSAEGGRSGLVDPALGGEIWMSAEALREETSGYAWIPSSIPPPGWSPASDEESAAIVGYSCTPGPPDPGAPPCDSACCQGGAAGGGSGPGGAGGCGGGSCTGGLATYTFNPLDASLVIRDMPLFYAPPRGPSVELKLTYKSRDDVQPQILPFGNLGYRWTFDWFSYAEEFPMTQQPDSVRVLLRGGGEEWHRQMAEGSGIFRMNYRSGAILVRTSVDPIRYERRLPDGSVDVFGLPDGAPAGERRVFLTGTRDPQGNALQFTYDSQFRLVTVTDAVGEVTTVTYDLAADPLKITRVTDPFGRSAVLTYNPAGQLQSITDMAGLVSSFTYVVGDYIGALTTPYGLTTFRHETRQNYDFWEPSIEATDPLGGT